MKHELAPNGGETFSRWRGWTGGALVEEVHRIPHRLQVQLPARRGRRNGHLAAQPFVAAQVEVLQNGLAVHGDEPVANRRAHHVHVAGVRPVAVVHSGEAEAAPKHGLRGEHQMRGVQRMHEVGREGELLTSLVHHALGVLADVDGLDRRANHVGHRLAVWLLAGEADGADPGDGHVQPVVGRGNVVEPLLDAHGLGEDGLDRAHNLAGDVDGQLPHGLRAQRLDALQLLQTALDLRHGTGAGHAVADGHDRLLHDLAPQDPVLQADLGQPRASVDGVAGRRGGALVVGAHLGDDLEEHLLVHVLRPLGGRQVDSGAAVEVPAERRVVLEPVAAPVLVDGHVAQVAVRVARREGRRVVHRRGVELEGRLHARPERLRHVGEGGADQLLDDGGVALHPRHALGERHLVHAVEVAEVHLEPEEPALAQRLLVRKLQQRAADVVAHVVEVRREGVHPAPEVDVLREVDARLQQKVLRHAQSAFQERALRQSVGALHGRGLRPGLDERPVGEERPDGQQRVRGPNGAQHLQHCPVHLPRHPAERRDDVEHPRHVVDPHVEGGPALRPDEVVLQQRQAARGDRGPRLGLAYHGQAAQVDQPPRDGVAQQGGVQLGEGVGLPQRSGQVHLYVARLHQRVQQVPPDCCALLAVPLLLVVREGAVTVQLRRGLHDAGGRVRHDARLGRPGKGRGGQRAHANAHELGDVEDAADWRNRLDTGGGAARRGGFSSPRCVGFVRSGKIGGGFCELSGVHPAHLVAQANGCVRQQHLVPGGLLGTPTQQTAALPLGVKRVRREAHELQCQVHSGPCEHLLVQHRRKNALGVLQPVSPYELCDIPHPLLAGLAQSRQLRRLFELHETRRLHTGRLQRLREALALDQHLPLVVHVVGARALGPVTFGVSRGR
ncbi:F-box/LRR-repeat protein 5 isoform X2 [Babesia caballi]|uniref:F-box/LRR-repeat protein 5 isoform X2 n=1 Tax=Babesia caballi TaxID=5871 RepID=A0AAV4LPC8_BABCB|nr:F-box/LRR-repeat protein 5 isoform X2 [Babesia caballi]